MIKKRPTGSQKSTFGHFTDSRWPPNFIRMLNWTPWAILTKKLENGFFEISGHPDSKSKISNLMDFHENPRFLRSHLLQSGHLKIVKSRFSIKNGVDVFITTQTIHLAKRKWSESRHPDYGGGDLSKNSKKSGFGGGGLRPKNRSFLGGLKFKSAPTCWWVQKSQKIHFRVRTVSMRKKFCWKRCINFQLDPRSGKCSKVDFSEGLGFLHRVKYIGIEKVPCKEWPFSIKWGFPKKKTSQLEDHFSRKREKRFF